MKHEVWKMNFSNYNMILCAIFATSIVLSILFTKVKIKGRKSDISFNLLFCGNFITSFLIFLPVCVSQYAESIPVINVIKIILMSFHKALGLLVIATDYSVIQEFAKTLNGSEATVFSIIAATVFVLSPLLTFGVILSFFKNLVAYISYAFSFFKDVYVFSELNEKSISLAKSIREDNKKSLVCFTDVYLKNGEKEYEAMEMAEQLNAICFKKDILSVRFNVNLTKKKIVFFAIDESESENLTKAFVIAEKYKNNKNASLYVFSSGREGEMMINSLNPDMSMKVLRVNPIRSLTYDLISGESGYGIFESAIQKEDEKIISALVIGMGEHGLEMSKALTWLCQMDGYKFVMNCFDKEANAEAIFAGACPELYDPKYNKKYICGDANYDITVHSGIDYRTHHFEKILNTIPEVTYVYISLGNDKLNIDASMRIGMLLNRRGIFPKIKAVVYNDDMNSSLNRISGDNIEFVSSNSTLYSREIIFGSDTEKAGLQRHRIYDKSPSSEKNFKNSEYNYRSSVSSAIHVELRKMCGIQGAHKPLEERTEKEKYNLASLEHRRWNAYMRSEGYILGAKKDHFMKTHTDIIPFDELSDEKKNLDNV